MVRPKHELKAQLIATQTQNDREANRAIWSCKGASGKLCCFRCLNCVRDRNIATRNVGFAHVSECDFGKFIVATDEAIWHKVESLPRQVAEHEARRATKASVDDLSTAIGFTYQTKGILFDRCLRKYIKPATHGRYMIQCTTLCPTAWRNYRRTC